MRVSPMLKLPLLFIGCLLTCGLGGQEKLHQQWQDVGYTSLALPGDNDDDAADNDSEEDEDVGDDPDVADALQLNYLFGDAARPVAGMFTSTFKGNNNNNNNNNNNGRQVCGLCV
jgi:hypothetical protein